MTRATLIRIQQHVDRLPRTTDRRELERRARLQLAIVYGILRAVRRRSGIAQDESGWFRMRLAQSAD